MLLAPDAIRLSTNGFACLPCVRQSRKRPLLQTRTNASLVMNTRYRQRQWRVYHMPIFALDNEVERIDNGAKLDSRTSSTYYLPDISAACFVRLSRTWTLRTRAPAACPRGLESGGLESRATDFGSGVARSSVWGSSVWGSRVWGSRVSGYGFRIWRRTCLS